MDNFLNVIKRDQEVEMKIKFFFDRCFQLPLNYQSKIGCDTLIQEVILKELMNLMGATRVDIDIELKMKISRIIYLESRSL